MKTLKKNAWLIATLVTALILASALIVGCIQPASSSGLKINGPTGEPGYTPQAGKGAVHLNLGKKGSARTIFPDKLEIGDFLSFTLNFTDEVGSNDQTVKVGPGASADYANFSAPIVIEEGEYTLKIIGYTTNNWTEPVAFAETGVDGGITKTLTTDDVITITISNSTPVGIDVLLKPYGINADEEGTFVWDITSSLDAPYTATIKVADWPIADALTTKEGSITAADLTTLKGTLVVTSGYKTVDLTLSKGTSQFKLRDIAHIYQNMTSTFTYDFSEDIIIVPGDTGQIEVTIDYEHPEFNDVKLTFSATLPTGGPTTIHGTGVSDDPIILSRSATGEPSGLTLTMTNSTPAPNPYYWYNFETLLGTANNPLVLLSSHTSFDTYTSNPYFAITLIGQFGAPYDYLSIPIYFKIID